MGELLQRIGQMIQMDNLDGALEVIERQVSNPAWHEDCVASMAAIAFRQGRIAQSLQLLTPLSRMDGQPSDVAEILAILSCMVGQLADALFYAKLSTTTPMTNELLPMFGPNLPSFMTAFQAYVERPLLELGKRYLSFDNYDMAALHLEQHLLVFPNDAEALDHYGHALLKLDRHREAIAILRSALTLAGPSAVLFNRLGLCLMAQGEIDAALSCHRQAVARAPKNWGFTAGLLRDLDYLPWTDSIAQQHARDNLTALLTRTAPKTAKQPQTARNGDQLTIGVLCGGQHDLESKAMIATLVRGFDRASCKLVGFGEGEMSHSLNAPYRDAFQVWRNISDMDELTLATIMRGEGLDVLLDSDGVLGYSRYGVMRHYGAVLQLGWLNSVDGLERLGCHGDLSHSPAGSLLLMPQGDCPDNAPLPMEQAGRVTFAADANLAELNSEVVGHWAAILHRVPDSMLLLRDHGFTDPDVLDRLITAFGNYGVAQRIDVVQEGDSADLFAEADIALAPFPVLRPHSYAAALQQGVPVVVLAQGQHGCRFARTLAGLQGAEDGITADLAAYVEQAAALAADAAALAERRQTLRSSSQHAASFDGKRLAASMEGYFRLRLSEMA